MRLSIEGMHCEGCVRRVTQALASVQGVRVHAVEVGAALVVFDAARVSPEQVAAAVNGIGFSAHIDRASAGR